jgi:hypothetical protein
MKANNTDEKVQNAPENGSRRRLVPVVAWTLGLAFLLMLVGVFLLGRAPHAPQEKQPAASQGLTAASPTAKGPIRSHREVAANQQTAPPPPAYQQPEPTPAMRQLVGSLVNLDPSSGAVTEEQALTWRTNLQSLIQQGAEAVPAISEFLAKNVDLAFNAGDRGALGYSSLRSAMLDALAQIGGPAAVNAMAQVLQTAADPREIALLGQTLEKLDPGAHQQEVLDAARESLSMAAEGKLAGRDVAPLFEVLQQFGGANAVADLERTAAQWNFYAMIGLAQLSDGAGIPSIVQMAESPAGANPGQRTAALEMLAQSASQSPDARAALVEQVRGNKLSAYDWATLASFLAGEQMTYQNSAFDNSLALVNPNDLRKTQASANQSLFTAPLGALTPDQIKQQNALLDELLAATSDPPAVQALQRAKSSLANRLIQIAGTAGK